MSKPVSRETLIERVRKMHNLAEGEKALGNLAAAENFASQVQKLLDKYHIQMSELSVTERNAQDPLGHHYVNWATYGIPVKHKRIHWLETLVSGVCYGHNCRFMVSSRSNAVWLVGRKADRDVAEFMLVFLTRLALELAEAGYWKARYQATRFGHYTTAGYKTSFLQAFADTISSRYTMLQRESQQEHSGMALVLSKSKTEVAEYLKQVSGKGHLNATSRSDKGQSSAGAEDGRAAAKNVELRKAVTEGRSGPGAKQLGGR